MSQLFYQCRLIFIGLLLISYQSIAAYKGSHAYNHTKTLKVQVNTATGTLSLTYPLIAAQGVRMPLKVSLTYSFNAHGTFGLPTGWQLDLDHINHHTAELGGMQWLIDNLWNDETGFASGLKYYNQHGTEFRDKGQSLPVPGYPKRSYRHVSQHKDGSRQFFSHQGLLMLQVDRFDNHVQFGYEEPVSSLESAKLVYIQDNYGNVYRFSYEPGAMIIHSPDNRTQRLYFDSQGVTSIENPLKQRYKITYINQFGRNLIRTMETPEGLINELTYGSIFYTDDRGKKQIPVVNRFKQYDQSNLKTHHETYYKFSEGNNYTGYPMYALSNTGDSLIDSNDQSYKYSVEVTHINGEQQRQQVYEYNYLHLPVEVRTLRQGQPFLKTVYKYAISPFKYSRSTNYDKPTEVTRYIWNESTYVPSDKTASTYDHYGNKLSEIRSVYDRQYQQWKALDLTVSRYFTDHYSLLAEHTRVDLLGGRAIRKSYALAPDNKTHSHERLAWKSHSHDWEDWQQTDLTHDDKGRQRSATRRWLAKNQPGVQSINHRIRYQFNPATAELTITKVSDQGREHTTIFDTRNARHLKTITPKGEVTTYTYDALNRPLTHTDPAGYVTRSTYETFCDNGQNTTTVQSPLGDTRRIIHDASSRSIEQQDLYKGRWRSLSSQSYDAFGKVASKSNILGLSTTFAYDEQGRRTQTIDPWGNEHRIEYNDTAMATTTRINGHRHQVIRQVPWERKRITQHYPITNNPHDQATELVENTVVHDAHKKMISTTTALVNLRSKKSRETVTSYLHYDAQNNLIASDTHAWDGLYGHKTRKYDLLNHLYTWHKTLKTPEHSSSHWGYRYHYDSDGLLTEVESPKAADGNRLYLQHHYDKNGREIAKTLQNGHRIHYQYDHRGLLTEHVWSRNQKRHSVNRQYDADGRLVKLSDSDGQTMHYRYTPNGRLLQIRYPDDCAISYTLDDYDRVITQKDANQTEQHFVYKQEDKGRLSSLKINDSRIDFHYGKDDNGQLGQLLKRTTKAKGTGVTQTHFRYGVFGQMVESTSTNPNTEFGVSYNYNPRGELFKQVQKLAKKGQPPQQYTTEYRYDGMQRLTDEVHTDQANSFQKRYHYDGNSNLLAEEDHSHCGPGQRLQYSYNALDQLVKVKRGEVVNPVLHDVNGHLTQDHQGTIYAYDDAGFLLQMQPQKKPATRYQYWPNGLLSRRSRGDSASHFYQDHHKNIQTVVKNGQGRSLVRHGKSIIGRQTDQGLDQFFKVNESTGAILQQVKDKTLLHLHRYDAYGRPLQCNPTEDTDFTWNQELTEPESGLTYLRHRFHHPQLRRFITRDNQHIDNRYAYSHGDPVNYIDPTGHSSLSKYLFSFGMAIAGIIGAILAVPTMGASEEAAVGVISTSQTISSIAQSSLPTATGIFTTLSGLSLYGSQLALDMGNKTVAKDLSIASAITGAFAAVSVAAMAPKILSVAKRFIYGIPSASDLEFSSISAVSSVGSTSTQELPGVLNPNLALRALTEEGETETTGLSNSNAPSMPSHRESMTAADKINFTLSTLNKRVDNEFNIFNSEQKGFLYNFSSQMIHSGNISYDSILSALFTYQPETIFTKAQFDLLMEQPDWFCYDYPPISGETIVGNFDVYANKLVKF